MENTLDNRIKELEKFDGNQVRSMSDNELKCFITAIYKVGFNDGYNEGWDDLTGQLKMNAAFKI